MSTARAHPCARPGSATVRLLALAAAINVYAWASFARDDPFNVAALIGYAIGAGPVLALACIPVPGWLFRLLAGALGAVLVAAGVFFLLVAPSHPLILSGALLLVAAARGPEGSRPSAAASAAPRRS